MVGDLAGSVQMVTSGATPYRPVPRGINVHNDALGGALAGAKARLELLHTFLKVILDGRVERRVQVVAVFRIEILVVLVEHGAAVAVARGDDHTVLAGQLVVVRRLKAHRAAEVIGKADDL